MPEAVPEEIQQEFPMELLEKKCMDLPAELPMELLEELPIAPLVEFPKKVLEESSGRNPEDITRVFLGMKS